MSMWLLVIIPDISLRFCVVSVFHTFFLILESLPSDIPFVIYSSHFQIMLSTLDFFFFLLLFKYCCTHPVHAHKDILKLCDVLFCVGHQSLRCSVQAPFKLGSFLGMLKDGPVRFEISVFTWPTKQNQFLFILY